MDRYSMRPPPLKQLRDADAVISACMPGNSFESAEVWKEQSKIAALTEPCPDWPGKWVNLHPDFDSLDVERRSAACQLERTRLWLFCSAYICPELVRHSDPKFLVTVTIPKGRCAPEELNEVLLRRIRRKIRQGIEKLRVAGYSPVYFACIEVSAARDIDGSEHFEPHIHMVISGAPLPAIRKAFKVRLPKHQRQRIRPVLIKKIRLGEECNVVGYITKMHPELRSGYERKDGVRSRRPNRMPPHLYQLWLEFMASISVQELVVFGGTPRFTTRKFSAAKMATIKGEM